MHHPIGRVSLKEVARKAQVSVSTASQALRGDGRIALATRERVMAAARKVGYQRHPLLSHLASKKFRPHSAAGTVLLAILPPRRQWSFHVLRWVEACRTLADGQGFKLEVADSSQLAPVEELCTKWRAQGVRGLLIGNSPRHFLLNNAAWNGFAVVNCGGYHMRPAHHTVKMDVTEGLVALWHQARQRGYRRIGFAMMRHADPIFDDWMRIGLARELAAQCDPCLPVHSGPLDHPEAFKNWLLQHRPDVVIGFPQIFGYWMEQTYEPGSRLPARLFLPCSSADAESGWFEDQALIAEEALRQLIDCVRQGQDRPPAVPRVTLVSGRWNEGETCPPLTVASESSSASTPAH